LALGLGVSVGEAREAAEVLVRHGIFIQLDEVSFKAAELP
jgi:hypothetical protein